MVYHKKHKVRKSLTIWEQKDAIEKLRNHLSTKMVPDKKHPFNKFYAETA